MALLAVPALQQIARRFSFSGTNLKGKYIPMDRWIVKGYRGRWRNAILATLYDLDYLSLTLTVLAGYLVTAALFTVLLLAAGSWQEASWKVGSGSMPTGPALVTAVYYLSLGALAQTSVALTDLAPASSYTICIIVAAHFVGIMMASVLLGVLINKASIPTAQIMFSNALLLTSRDGQPVWIFRIANTSGNFLINPEIRISYLQNTQTEEGEELTRLVKIAYEPPPSQAPCINIACEIGEDSPLRDKTFADLRADRASVIISLTAIDNRHFQPVFARKMYTLQDFRVNCRFDNLISTNMRGERTVDFSRFNLLVQNDSMPVSYGLTPEEVLAINGMAGKPRPAPPTAAVAHGSTKGGLAGAPRMEVHPGALSPTRHSLQAQAADANKLTAAAAGTASVESMAAEPAAPSDTPTNVPPPRDESVAGGAGASTRSPECDHPSADLRMMNKSTQGLSQLSDDAGHADGVSPAPDIAARDASTLCKLTVTRAPAAGHCASGEAPSAHPAPAPPFDRGGGDDAVAGVSLEEIGAARAQVACQEAGLVMSALHSAAARHGDESALRRRSAAAGHASPG